VVQTGQTALCVGSIAGHEEELGVLGGDDPSFIVQLGNANAVAYGKGLLFGEERRAGVALLLGRVPVLVVAGKIQFDLTGLELRLLQAEAVSVYLMEKVLKTLLNTGSQAVYVPGNQSHGNTSL
jgi:hypothetical protein